MRTFLLIFYCLIKFLLCDQIIYIEDYCSHHFVQSEPNLTSTGDTSSITLLLSRTDTLTPDKQFCWLRITTDEGYRIFGNGTFGHLQLLMTDARNRIDLGYDPFITDNNELSLEFESPLVITLENRVRNFVNHSALETRFVFTSVEINDQLSSSGDIPFCDGFTCENDRCIALEMRCDNFDDCGDNSDEQTCGTTNAFGNILAANPMVSGSTVVRFVFAGYFYTLINIILINT